jgi:hypothetical protein
MTVNHINAGIIHTRARMAGLTIDGALELARHGSLDCDIHNEPHRPSVVRILRRMWARHDAEAARDREARERQAAIDAAVSAMFPEEWARVQAMTGKARREARRELRARWRAAETY